MFILLVFLLGADEDRTHDLRIANLTHRYILRLLSKSYSLICSLFKLFSPIKPVHKLLLRHKSVTSEVPYVV